METHADHVMQQLHNENLRTRWRIAGIWTGLCAVAALTRHWSNDECDTNWCVIILGNRLVSRVLHLEYEDNPVTIRKTGIEIISMTRVDVQFGFQ